jgi:hypothetical protein
LTRTDVVPAGTSNGTITYDPCCARSNSPVITWSTAIGSPGQEAGTPSAWAAAGAVRATDRVAMKARWKRIGA